MLRRTILITPLAAVMTLHATGAYGQRSASLDRITLPPGFSIDIYVEGLSSPRSMALSPNGTLFVGTRGAPWLLEPVPATCKGAGSHLHAKA